jgi:hypothetical protein
MGKDLAQTELYQVAPCMLTLHGELIRKHPFSIDDVSHKRLGLLAYILKNVRKQHTLRLGTVSSVRIGDAAWSDLIE